MKKGLKAFVLIILVLCLCCTLFACGDKSNGNDGAATITSITVTGQKTAFTVGDEFAKGDMTVTLNYSDGTTQTADLSQVQIDSSAYNANAVGNYNITVTYQGFSATYAVTVSEIPPVPTYTVTFVSNGGSAVSPVRDVTGGASIALPAQPTRDGYTFNGWFTDDATFQNEFTATTAINADTTVYAKWKPYLRIDSDGTPNANGSYILFGEYPQTIKADAVTVGTSANSLGYFLGSDGFYYAKVVSTPYGSGYTFSNGATVTSGETYYFKIEPIKWRILSESNGNALILCESAIDNHRYDESSNNYANSEIRVWLNDEFYNTAFNTLQRQIIQVTNVDNSAASTGYDSNPYACENTNDKIFLPSYAEITNSAYGFVSNNLTTDSVRIKLTSDYSRSKGIYMSNDNNDNGNGYWWLRSPFNNDISYARFVYSDGKVAHNNCVYYTYNGVVPALTINL